MNKESFFQHYPERRDDSSKADNGRVFLLSGSYGMAGACILNIMGAQCSGAGYIDVCLPDDIYPIVAGKQICAVYHPDKLTDPAYLQKLLAPKKADSMAIGSGLNNHPFKKEYLKDLLMLSKVPVIVDAEGLRILAEHEEFYQLNHNMILTPHLGEFSALSGLSIEQIRENRQQSALQFAREKGVILVLKGPQSLIVSPDGQLTVNNSGNSALARAGSGDVLTGMIAGLAALYDDPYQAAVDAVWLHGHLADEALKNHSKETFDLTGYPELADRFFFKH